MINIRTKMILAFLITVAVSLTAAFGISYTGYKVIVSGIAASADNNNERVNCIQQIRELIGTEQQLSAECIINLNISIKEDFIKDNGLVTALIDKLMADTASNDANELKKLKEFNVEYLEAFNNTIVTGVLNSDTKELDNLVESFNANHAVLIGLEQKLKDSLFSRTVRRLDRLADVLKNLSDSYDRQVVEAGDLSNKVDTLNKKISSFKNLPVAESVEQADREAKEFLDEIIVGLSELGTGLGELNSKDGTVLNIPGQDYIAGIKGDISYVDLASLLIYHTQAKKIISNYALNLDDDKASKYTDAATETGKYVDKLEKMSVAQDKALLDNIKSSDTALNQQFDDILKLGKKIREQNLTLNFSDISELYGQQLQSLSRLENSFRQYLAEDVRKSNDMKAFLLWSLLGMALLSLIVGMVIALLISRNIIKPIRNITNLLGKAEAGDLTVRTQLKRKDEIGKLSEKVNNVLAGQQSMVEQFSNTRGDIGMLREMLSALFIHNRVNTDKIDGSAKRAVERIKADLKRHETSMKEISQIAAGVEDFSSATDQVVKDGMRAIENAVTGEKSVEEAENAIKNMTGTVKEIADSINQLDESSSKISIITNTITEIASRTNLLALNAAIEAAKAGQQGKGFTVLADEIRKLAEGSNKAAGEIKALISEIQKRIGYAVERIGLGISGVDEGVARINNARQNIYDITESIRFIIDSLKNAAETVRGQKSLVDELSKIMEGLNKTAESEVAVVGHNEENGVEKQRDVIVQMEELTRKLDIISENMSAVLERFII